MQNPLVSLLGTVTIGAALIGFSAVAQPTPIVIWNASASVPIGLYLVVSGVPEGGDFVLVRAPEAAAHFANQRGYLPVGIPLVKRLAASVGDKVCSSNLTVQINGAAVAHQLEADRSGRSLPRWNECRELGRDEYFLLADAPDSFDSRYFGPVKSDRVIGRLVPLWTK